MQTNRYTRVLLLSAMTLAVPGCSRFRGVGGQEFMAIGDRPALTAGNTFPAKVEFIGVTETRAYLEYRPGLAFFGPPVIVYWTPLSELPEDLQLKRAVWDRRSNRGDRLRSELE